MLRLRGLDRPELEQWLADFTAYPVSITEDGGDLLLAFGDGPDRIYTFLEFEAYAVAA